MMYLVAGIIIGVILSLIIAIVQLISDPPCEGQGFLCFLFIMCSIIIGGAVGVGIGAVNLGLSYLLDLW